MRAEVRRLRGADRGRVGDERVELVSCSVGLKRRSNPIVVEGFELIALPQSEPATWPGNTSTPSASSSRRRSEWKRPLGSFQCSDREIGPGGVADEERVAGEHEPGLVAARAIDDREAAVLRPMPRRVDDSQRDGADLDLVAVAHRVVGVVDARVGVHADGNAVLQCKAAVPGDVVGVRVRLDRSDDADVAALGLVEHRLDRERRVDDPAIPASSSPTR